PCSVTVAPGRLPDRRRGDVLLQDRINPELNAATVALPDTLQHSHQLLPVSHRSQDVVMEERTAKDGNPPSHLIEGTSHHEYRVGQLACPLARGNRPLHGENRSHMVSGFSEEGSVKLRQWRSRDHFPRVVTLCLSGAGTATVLVTGVGLSLGR